MMNDVYLTGVAVEIAKYVSAEWKPKEDITAFELASMLHLFLGGWLTEEKWKELGAMQRHFVRQN